MEETNSYTYFGIESNGEIAQGGLTSYPKGMFNPEDISNLLGIHAFSSWAYGDKRKDGSKYLFSSWSAEKSAIERLDAEAQCRDTIKRLKNKIPLLKQIKEQYDVNFILVVVPSVHGEEAPYIGFEEEIIGFCYLTGTTITVDMYIYPAEDEKNDY